LILFFWKKKKIKFGKKKISNRKRNEWKKFQKKNEKNSIKKIKISIRIKIKRNE